jgi:hypothetical protein
MVDFLLCAYIYYQTQEIMNVNRFKQLLESTMGDVRPLISEQATTGTTQPVAAGGGAAAKTVKINGVDVSTYDDSTGKNKTYFKILDQAYDNLGNNKIGIVNKSKAWNPNYEIAVDINGKFYNVSCEDLDTLSELPLSTGAETGKKFKIDDENMRLMLKRFCMTYHPTMELSYRATTPLYDK